MPQCEARNLILNLATEVEHMDVQTTGFAQRLKQLSNSSLPMSSKCGLAQ
jgi:hypothetical protein